MTSIFDQLDATVPDAPPSPLDLDSLVHRSRRTVRLRAAAGTVGGVGLAGAVVALAFLVARPAGPVPTAAPPSGTALTARLDAAVRVALATIAPDVKVLSGHTVGDAIQCQPVSSPLPNLMVVCEAVPDEDSTLPLHEVLQVQRGTRQALLSVHVDLTSSSGVTSCTATVHGTPSPSTTRLDNCTETTLHGVRLVILGEQPGTGAHYPQYYAVHPGDVLVTVQVDEPLASPGEVPLFSDAELRALATDPILVS